MKFGRQREAKPAIDYRWRGEAAAFRIGFVAYLHSDGVPAVEAMDLVDNVLANYGPLAVDRESVAAVFADLDSVLHGRALTKMTE